MDKEKIVNNFSNASVNYNLNSQVQKQVASNLVDKILKFTDNSSQILDIGAGTGYIAKKLDKEIVQLDISAKMLEENGAKNIVVADFENLPFQDENFDLILSSFALQWSSDIEKVFLEAYKVLKKDGIFAFAIPLFESLNEIKKANLYAKTNFFMLDLPKFEKMKNERFLLIDSSQEVIKKQYESGVDCLKKIKSIGAGYQIRDKKTLSRKKVKIFNDFFAQEYHNMTNWHVGYFIFKKI